MKNTLLTLCVIVSTSTAFAETLLTCSPPWGSSLQEVKFTEVGGEYFRTELNSSGAFSKPIPMTASSWTKKDMRWESGREGKVHMQLVTVDSQEVWSYRAEGYGVLIVGYCNEL